MDPLAKDLREFIELLNSHDVRYLIVGGFAVAYHGFPRMTGDIDFFVEATEQNAERLAAVLEAFGFGSLGLKASDFTEPDTIIQLGYPPNRIDIITTLSGTSWAEAWAIRQADEIDGLPTQFIGRETLLINKRAAGRPKDLIDLDALE